MLLLLSRRCGRGPQATFKSLMHIPNVARPIHSATYGMSPNDIRNVASRPFPYVGRSIHPATYGMLPDDIRYFAGRRRMHYTFECCPHVFQGRHEALCIICYTGVTIVTPENYADFAFFLLHQCNKNYTRV